MNFKQAKPKNIVWTLVEGDKRSGQLRYKSDTETIVVPNIWYNQPVEWRIEIMRFYADCNREGARRLRKFPTNERNLERAAFNDQKARELDDLAARMAATGEILA